MSNSVTTINDGNYNVPIQDGPDVWRFPFSEKGDNVSFECIRDIVVREHIYKPPAPMQKYTTRLGTAYLVNEGDAEQLSCGLIKIRRTLASVPQPRNEWSNYPATFMYPFVGEGSGDFSQFTYTVNARTYWEYGLQPFKPLISPRIVVISGVSQYIGASNLPHKKGDEFPGEDSQCERYKSGIYYRATIYVRWPI